MIKLLSGICRTNGRDGNLTGSFVHAAVPVDICKDMELAGNVVTCIFPAAAVIIGKH